MTNTRPWLPWILIASVLSTAAHYSHNLYFIDRYPQPAWITRPSIVVVWLLMTLLGLAGYRLYLMGRSWSASICLLIYSATGLSSAGHYGYGSPAAFSSVMHLFILTDVLTGLAVVGFVVWLTLARRRRATK